MKLNEKLTVILMAILLILIFAMGIPSPIPTIKDISFLELCNIILVLVLTVLTLKDAWEYREERRNVGTIRHILASLFTGLTAWITISENVPYYKGIILIILFSFINYIIVKKKRRRRRRSNY